MANKQQIYRDGDRYVALTGKCPKGFKDVLFVTFTGPDASSVTEGVMGKDELAQMESVDEAPEDWSDAFEAVGIKRRKRSTFPSSVRPPRYDTEEEFFGHVAAGTDLFTAAAVSGYEPESPTVEPVDDLAHAIGIGWLCIIALGLFSYLWW